MVNRYNQEGQGKCGQKKRKKGRRKPPQPLTTSVGHLVIGGGMAVGGGGIRREGVLVRECSGGGWKEETQSNTKGCGLREGCDQHYVLFWSQTTLPLLCICAATCLCLSDVYAQTKVCYAEQMIVNNSCCLPLT